MDMDSIIDRHLKSDRQWPRHLRMANAQYELRKAATKPDQDFWLEVLRRNGFYDKPGAQR